MSRGWVSGRESARGPPLATRRETPKPGPGLNAGGVLSSLGLSKPALSFSFSLKLSPLILSVIEWCSRRSRMGLAITASPNTSPQALRLWLLVMMIEPRSLAP
jgi:hypothetical protein